jgi:hypothetical protein
MSPEDLLPAVAPVLMYLDPASGSLLLQLIAAGAVGAWVFFKMWGRRIRMFFRSEGDSDE